MNVRIGRWLPFGIILIIILVMSTFMLINRRSSIYVPDTYDPAIIYADACAGCHGPRGQGSGLFNLALDSEKIKQSEISNIIRNGSLMMPAFTMIKNDALQQLVEYVAGKKFLNKNTASKKTRYFSE